MTRATPTVEIAVHDEERNLSRAAIGVAASQPGPASRGVIPIEALMFNHAGAAIYELMYEVATAADMAIVPPDSGPFRRP